MRTQKTQQPLPDLNTLLLTQTDTVSHGKKKWPPWNARSSWVNHRVLKMGGAVKPVPSKTPKTLWGLLTVPDQVMGAVQDLNSCLSTLKQHTLRARAKYIWGRKEPKRTAVTPKTLASQTQHFQVTGTESLKTWPLTRGNQRLSQNCGTELCPGKQIMD